MRRQYSDNRPTFMDYSSYYDYNPPPSPPRYYNPPPERSEPYRNYGYRRPAPLPSIPLPSHSMPARPSPRVQDVNKKVNNRKRFKITPKKASVIVKPPEEKKETPPPVKTVKPKKGHPVTTVWTLADAERAIKAELECLNNHLNSTTLVVKFPDPEINENIVKGFSDSIENVVFYESYVPRHCYVNVKPGTVVDQIIAELSQTKFGTGTLEVFEKKKSNELQTTIKPDEIDPFVLHVGNLPSKIVAGKVKQHFISAVRIEVRLENSLKNTRYALIHYKTSDEALVAFMKSYNKVIEGKKCLITFRRRIECNKNTQDENSLTETSLTDIKFSLSPTTETSSGTEPVTEQRSSPSPQAPEMSEPKHSSPPIAEELHDSETMSQPINDTDTKPLPTPSHTTEITPEEIHPEQNTDTEVVVEPKHLVPENIEPALTDSAIKLSPCAERESQPEPVVKQEPLEKLTGIEIDCEVQEENISLPISGTRSVQTIKKEVDRSPNYSDSDSGESSETSDDDIDDEDEDDDDEDNNDDDDNDDDEDVEIQEGEKNDLDFAFTNEIARIKNQEKLDIKPAVEDLEPPKKKSKQYSKTIIENKQKSKVGMTYKHSKMKSSEKLTIKKEPEEEDSESKKQIDRLFELLNGGGRGSDMYF